MLEPKEEQNSVTITISDERYQEVVDHINECGTYKFTTQHLKDSDLPINLQTEIAENTYTDTCQMDSIMDHLSESQVKMPWPMYGDSDMYKNEWARRIKEKGLR